MTSFKKGICMILIFACLISSSGCLFRHNKDNIVTDPEMTPTTEPAAEAVGVQEQESPGNPNAWAREKEELSSEKQQEIKDEIARIESENITRKVVWFQIDCHDGLEHIYYATRNMAFYAWLKTSYNTDGWVREGDMVVNQQCTLYLSDLPYGVDTVIEEGAKYDTDIYTQAVAANGNPVAMSGALMEEYIGNFVPGVEIRDGNIVVKEQDANGSAAIETVYAYENGILKDIVVIYYCIDEAVDGFEEYLGDSGQFYNVVRQGNVLSCYRVQEDVEPYKAMTRGALYQMLLTMSEGKELVEVIDETGE